MHASLLVIAAENAGLTVSSMRRSCWPPRGQIQQRQQSAHMKRWALTLSWLGLYLPPALRTLPIWRTVSKVSRATHEHVPSLMRQLPAG